MIRPELTVDDIRKAAIDCEAKIAGAVKEYAQTVGRLPDYVSVTLVDRDEIGIGREPALIDVSVTLELGRR